MLVVVVAENQLPVAENIAKQGLGINLGWYTDVKSSDVASAFQQLMQMNSNGANQRLIDGKGADRVVRAMRAPEITLRRADQSDCRRLWQWRNDPVVRINAFSQTPVPYEDHCRWLASKLSNESCYLFIAESGAGQPVGQVRLDVADDQAEIHFALAESARGKGLASAAIDLAIQSIETESRIGRVIARIKSDNTPSLRAFANAFFEPRSADTVAESNCVVFERKCLTGEST